jgi:tRNA-specific 2-thiouridylase
MKKSKQKGIVFVGLSGGVDSSVSAALLQAQGFDVRGVFIKVWQPDMAITGGCTWREDRLDAMRVCAKLHIPFYTLDLEKEYKKEVVDYMIAEYRSGRTPNPDVMCNKYIKFGGFFDWAMKQGANYVATGHYSKIKIKKSKCKIEYRLLAGSDKNKDQSYFLWTLTQKQLSKTLFPVGDIEKPQVRNLAKRFGLETADKKDSQGICFIGKVEMTDFLKEYIKPKIGKVLNEVGEIIGIHEGVFYYTLGQRHGFTITKKTNHDRPYFIVGKDLKHNTLTVSFDPLKEKDIASKEIKIKNVNWTLGAEPDLEKEYFARIRYRQPLEKCHLLRQGATLTVKFQKPQKAVTAGQSVVLYDKETCLGGGIIV